MRAEALERDRKFVREMMGTPSTNGKRLSAVREALSRAIKEDLSPRQREIVVMRYFENKSGKEIARELGVHPSTVCRTLQRARKILERSLRFCFAYLNRNFDDD